MLSWNYGVVFVPTKTNARDVTYLTSITLQCFLMTCVFVGDIWPRFNRQVHWGRG